MLVHRRACARRVLLVAALIAAFLAGGVPAQADEVGKAQDRVDRLQKVQQDTTRRLLEGTRTWEADQAALHRTRLALRNTRRHLGETKAVLASEQARVAVVARSLYMNPAPTGLQLAFTRTPDEVLEALQAHAGLNRAAGSQAQVIARAALAKHRLRGQEAAALDLERKAEQLVSSSAARMAKLQALAQSTADQLDAAAAGLTRARAAVAARRAALARAARIRASGGASCTGRSTAGQQNGNLDPASLCPLWKAPGHRLRADAASAFNKLSQYRAATVGGALCVTDSYRSYSEQVALYRNKPGLAAVPGTSEHGWGKAVDLCGGVQNSGSSAYDWMKANAGRFGWFHPDWAEPGGSRPEAWHWEFGG